MEHNSHLLQTLADMATPQKQKEADHNQAFASQLAPLPSPAEPKRTADVFSSPVSVSMSRSNSQSISARPAGLQSTLTAASLQTLPLSPPISPYKQTEDVIVVEEGTRDPPLFPREDSDLVKQPLFPEPEDGSTQSTVRRHMAQTGKICAEEDYQLVLDTMTQMKFTTRLGEMFQQDPRAYIQMCVNDLNFYDNIARQKREAAKAAKTTIKTSAPRRLAPAPEGGIRKKVTTPRVQRVPKPKVSPPQHTFGTYTFPAKEVSSPKAPKLATSRDDIDFNSLPDYCPPTTNLGSNAKALKADWKGQVLDLSADPDKHLLHEAEVNLAATLRLSCAVYLSSKRRIFMARVACLSRGKDFRKTDAQQACKIDVNKASKLWTAFDRVNWFDDRYFVGQRI